MKYRKTKKKLSHEEANQIFMNCQQAIQAETENVVFWENKRKKDGKFYLKHIDVFMLCNKHPTQVIAESEEKINYLSDKMDDMRNFFDASKKVLKIF